MHFKFTKIIIINKTTIFSKEKNNIISLTHMFTTSHQNNPFIINLYATNAYVYTDISSFKSIKYITRKEFSIKLSSESFSTNSQLNLARKILIHNVHMLNVESTISCHSFEYKAIEKNNRRTKYDDIYKFQSCIKFCIKKKQFHVGKVAAPYNNMFIHIWLHKYCIACIFCTSYS